MLDAVPPILPPTRLTQLMRERCFQAHPELADAEGERLAADAGGRFAANAGGSD